MLWSDEGEMNDPTMFILRQPRLQHRIRHGCSYKLLSFKECSLWIWIFFEFFLLTSLDQGQFGDTHEGGWGKAFEASLCTNNFKDSSVERFHPFGVEKTHRECIHELHGAWSLNVSGQWSYKKWLVAGFDQHCKNSRETMRVSWTAARSVEEYGSARRSTVIWSPIPLGTLSAHLVRFIPILIGGFDSQLYFDDDYVIGDPTIYS